MSVSEKGKDYSTFGMLMPGRQFSSGNGYRWGFSGYEKDDEITGSPGSHIDMGDRHVDTRILRTPKPDRKANEYPGLSPYSYAANNPIRFIDKNGENPAVPVIIVGGVVITVADAFLISAGIVTTGILLHKAADGSFALNYDITNPFGPVSSRSTSRGNGTGDGTGTNYSGKPRGNWDPLPPNLGKGLKAIAFGVLSTEFFKRVYKGMQIPEPPKEEQGKGPLQLFFKQAAFEPVEEAGEGTVEVTLSYDINYTVQKGDNLTKIAKQFNTTVDDLTSTNQIKDKNVIQTGQTLKVGEGTYSYSTTEAEIE